MASKPKPHTISLRRPPPPRALNVQKFAESRASELESLHSIISNRLNGDFRTARSKRRRTTSHDNRTATNRSRKRRKLAAPVNADDGVKADLNKAPRRIRRTMELVKNPESGFCVSGDGTKRLRTHLWHAKRFRMIKRWGFYLPLGLHGRGRGSRAILKRLKSGALMHDASYCCAVQLEGPEESLLKILKLVLVPSPLSLSELSRSLFCEGYNGSAMLHHVGAPDSPLIAPVTYMWRRDLVDLGVEKDPIPNGHQCQESECCMPFRQLWVWLHPAAFDEGFNVLSSACRKLMTEDGVSISCLSLEGHLGKLEIMGSKAVQILQKVLHPVFGVSNASKDSQLRKCSALKDGTCYQLEKISIRELLESLPSHSILSLTVEDPRDKSMKGIKDVPTTPSCPESQLSKDNSKEGTSLMSGDANNDSEVISSTWSNPELNDLHFSSRSLWTSSDRINPPMDENALCMVKHQRRLAFFYLDNSNSGLSTITEGGTSRSCPIFLLKNNQMGSCTRWSIILPVSWVKAFWIPLISNGAQAIGLQERRWISCDDGVPSFPFDFPDCKAYSSFMAAEAIASDQELHHRPLAMRPLRIPIPPPWDSVRATILEGSARGGYDQLLDTETHYTEMAFSRSLVTSDPEDHDATSLAKDSFQGLVARTSNVLSGYLNETHCSNLLLFPNSTIMGKNCFSMLMDKGRLGWAPKRDYGVPIDRKLCFLRVLLRAYKRGVFEEGAVVCAPILTDLPLSTDRSEEDLPHIPQHLIELYFTQQQSGQWKLQIPEDPANQQSFRWPIGFVTSGFVRGSTKPAAEAFCEATVLAQLRGEQWREMQEKGRPDILVLVRNLQSTAYRLALATIVLEQQQHDLEFM